MTQTSQIQINMLDETIREAKKIQETTSSLSFSDAIKTSIDIAYLVIDAIEKGNKIIIEESWGRKYQLNIDGLNA